MIYSFNGFELPLVESFSAPMASRIATAETPARAGQYQGRRQAASRTITVIGTLTANSFTDLQTAWSNFQAAHDVSSPKALSIREGFYFYAIPDAVSESDVQPASLHYQVDYKIADPFAYSYAVNTETLNINGTTVVTAGGNKFALPTISFVVGVAPSGGSIVVWNQTTGEKATIRPSAAQQYRFNCRTEKMELGLMSEFSGQFPSLAVGANTISVTAAGGTTLVSASISWRNRSL